jgi:hypothetical protein
MTWPTQSKIRRTNHSNHIHEVWLMYVSYDSLCPHINVLHYKRTTRLAGKIY